MDHSKHNSEIRVVVKAIFTRQRQRQNFRGKGRGRDIETETRQSGAKARPRSRQDEPRHLKPITIITNVLLPCKK